MQYIVEGKSASHLFGGMFFDLGLSNVSLCLNLDYAFGTEMS